MRLPSARSPHLRNLAFASVVVVALWLAAPPASAMGGGGGGAGGAPSPGGRSADADAVEAYKAGEQLRDEALALQARAADATDAEERRDLEKGAEKRYKRALRKFKRAARKRRKFAHAYNQIGFCERMRSFPNSARKIACASRLSFRRCAPN